MKRNGTIVSGIIITALLTQCFGTFRVSVNAQEIPATKQYVIVAEDDNSYSDAVEKITNNITTKTPILSDNNVIVAKLTEDEVSALTVEKDLLVEEDIILSANSAENETLQETTDEEESMESISEETLLKKEELKRRKDEIFAKIAENKATNDGTVAEDEWNIQAINADNDTVQEKSISEKVKVAVLDSGVDYVSGINLAGYVNLVEDEQEISPMFQDMTGHGTGIAGIIAGNGETGIHGINPNVELYSVKVLDDENIAPLSRIIRGIYWCIENDIDIINMSFGTTSYSKTLEQAVADAYHANILMVGAAGNENGSVEYPAAFQQVMAVAATNPNAEISNFSNTGEALEIAAPGEKIRTAGFFNGNVVTHGTSIAVPHVVGVAALLWEKDLTKSNEFIRQLIRYSAKEMPNTEECGLLDAKYALEIFDSFAESFDGQQLELDAQITGNAKEPKSFENVNNDTSYVEGRWNSSGHKDTIDSGSAIFSTDEIRIIKKGAVYPDTPDYLQGGQAHPPWHGKWKWPDRDGKTGTVVNYVAAFDMITSIAAYGENPSYLTSPSEVPGINSATFDEVKTGITTLYSKFSSILGADNTKANRKLFLFGCGLHTMTDTFAHSTTKPDGTLIKHNDTVNYTKPDDITYYPKRYKVAVKATEYSLISLSQGECGDGYEILKALNDEYTDNASYLIIRLKKYVNANGYTGAVLNRANIDNPN